MTEETARKIDEIHDALCGTIDGKNPGIYQRISVLENFRKNFFRFMTASWTLIAANIGTIVALYFKLRG